MISNNFKFGVIYQKFGQVSNKAWMWSGGSAYIHCSHTPRTMSMYFMLYCFLCVCVFLGSLLCSTLFGLNYGFHFSPVILAAFSAPSHFLRQSRASCLLCGVAEELLSAFLPSNEDIAVHRFFLLILQMLQKLKRIVKSGKLSNGPSHKDRKDRSPQNAMKTCSSHCFHASVLKQVLVFHITTQSVRHS